MDAIRFYSDPTAVERAALRVWLRLHGRVSVRDDQLDGTLLTWFVGTDVDLAITRDETAYRVHYATFADPDTREPAERWQIERRFVQLEGPPAAFPPELDARRVTV